MTDLLVDSRSEAVSKHHIFVYGTLLGGCFGAEFVGPATISGSIWHLHSYPAVQVLPEPTLDHEEHRVVGEVYRVTDEELRALDRYEGYPNLYQREEVTAIITPVPLDQFVEDWWYEHQDLANNPMAGDGQFDELPIAEYHERYLPSRNVPVYVYTMKDIPLYATLVADGDWKKFRRKAA